MKTGTVVKALLSVLFLALIAFRIDWGRFLEMFSGISRPYFMLSLLITFAMVVVSCLKWQLMIRMQGHRADFPFLLKTYFIGYFFSMLLPSNVGGDVVRSYYAGKRVGDQYTSFVASFIERFSGSIFLLLMALAAPLFKRELLGYWRMTVPMAASAFLLLLFTLLAFRRDLVEKIGGLLLKSAEGVRSLFGGNGTAFPERLFERLVGLYGSAVEKGRKFSAKLGQAVASFNRMPRYLTWTIALTAAFYILTWFNVQTAFRTFHIEVPLGDIIILLPAIMIVSLIPLTLGSIGLAEGAYVFYFSLVDVSAESAFVMSLLLRFKLILLAVTGYLFFLTHKHRREELREMAAREGIDR